MPKPSPLSNLQRPITHSPSQDLLGIGEGSGVGPRRLHLLVGLLFLTACAAPLTPAPRSPATRPAPTSSIPTAQIRILPATASPQPSGPWVKLADGIEAARIMARDRDEVLLTRIDPARVELSVRYDAVTPRSVRDWQAHTGNDVVINAGFFTEQHTATGLVIADGKTHGSSYAGYGGMFALRGGKPSLQWLAITPYKSDPGISSAVQAFPMLLQAGQRTPNLPQDARASFRSFVAIDKQGRVLLGVCESPTWTLAELAQWLAATPELGVVSALNLDGGRSSGLWLKSAAIGNGMESFDVVPSVITARLK